MFVDSAFPADTTGSADTVTGTATTNITTTTTTTTTVVAATATAQPILAGADAEDQPAAQYPALDAIYGGGCENIVRKARLLVVGAGGVGCELVKNLASVGFGHVTLVDLDTIDFSNLNRQFLFRRKHVGKPKATQAAEAIQELLPGTVVHGIMANIKNPRFSIDFFKTFNVVCNALDNLDARRHVNRMCLAANVPLIDSGSTGYTGQVDVLGHGFECYDCIKRPEPKSFAVCTIRSTPERPVHCVVWAKFLLQLIFGAPDNDNMLSDLDGVADVNAGIDTTVNIDSDAQAPKPIGESGTLADGENRSIVANGHFSADVNDDSALKASNLTQVGNGGTKTDEHMGNGTAGVSKRDTKHLSKRVRLLPTDTEEGFARRVCERVFVDDIEEQRRMESLWVDRAAPETIDVPNVANGHLVKLDDVNPLSQTVWDVNMSAAVFFQVLQHFADKRRHDIGNVKFDKDDRDAVLFVTAAANLRAAAYGVELSSPFSVKGIAGNIVHAIATTNAVVGGLVVLEAIKLVTSGGDVSKCKKTFVVKNACGSRVRSLLLTDPMREPNKQCFVCSEGQLTLSVDVEDMTLGTLVESVLQAHMSVAEPSVHVTTGEFHNTVYESGTGLDEDEIETYNNNSKKTLSKLHVRDGSQLVVEDLRQNLRCTLHVRHVDKLLAELSSDQRFVIDGSLSEKNGMGEERAKPDGKAGVSGEVEDVDDDAEEVQVMQKEPDRYVVENSDMTTAQTVKIIPAGVKRPLSVTRAEEFVTMEEQSNLQPVKKPRSDAPDATARQ